MLYTRNIRIMAPALAALVCACGIFLPRQAEWPRANSTTRFSDPLRLLHLMGMSSDLAFISDYRDVFNDSARYIHTATGETFDKSACISLYQSMPSKYFWYSVTWTDTVTPALRAQASDTIRLETGYQVAAVLVDSAGRPMPDTASFSAPSMFIFKKKDVDKLEIVRWEDGWAPQTGQPAKSFFYP